MSEKSFVNLGMSEASYITLIVVGIHVELYGKAGNAQPG